MRVPARLAATAVACAFALAAPAHAAYEELLELPIETYTLDNGLEVILHEDHTLPLAAVNVWYHVGSANEVQGRTGFAHLFEHLMFQGSAHYDQEYFSALAEGGAAINGSTSTDRTNYFQLVPNNFLERALWLEADRMGWLLPALTQEKLDNQREVVRNERRQNYENRPYGHRLEAPGRALLPRGPPLPPPDDRLPRGPAGRRPQRRARLLHPLVRAQQRDPRGGRRLRSRRGARLDRAATSGPSRRGRGRAPGHRRARHSSRRACGTP